MPSRRTLLGGLIASLAAWWQSKAHAQPVSSIGPADPHGDTFSYGTVTLDPGDTFTYGETEGLDDAGPHEVTFTITHCPSDEPDPHDRQGDDRLRAD